MQKTPVYIEELTPLQLATLIHTHAAQIANADPDIDLKEAIAKATELAVLAFDVVTLTKGFENAAKKHSVRPLLAKMIARKSSTASASLTNAA